MNIKTYLVLTLFVFVLTGCFGSRNAVNLGLPFEDSRQAVLDQSTVRIELFNHPEFIRAQVTEMTPDSIYFQRKRRGRAAWEQEAYHLENVRRVYNVTTRNRLIGVPLGMVPGIIRFITIDTSASTISEADNTNRAQFVAVGLAVLGGAIGGVIGSNREKEIEYYNYENR